MQTIAKIEKKASYQIKYKVQNTKYKIKDFLIIIPEQMLPPLCILYFVLYTKLV